MATSTKQWDLERSMESATCRFIRVNLNEWLRVNSPAMPNFEAFEVSTKCAPRTRRSPPRCLGLVRLLQVWLRCQTLRPLEALMSRFSVCRVHLGFIPGIIGFLLSLGFHKYPSIYHHILTKDCIMWVCPRDFLPWRPFHFQIYTTHWYTYNSYWTPPKFRIIPNTEMPTSLCKQRNCIASKRMCWTSS